MELIENDSYRYRLIYQGLGFDGLDDQISPEEIQNSHMALYTYDFSNYYRVYDSKLGAPPDMTPSDPTAEIVQVKDNIVDDFLNYVQE